MARPDTPSHQELYAGLIRLHILHHAVEEGPIYGLWMIDELARHGYRISAGTLYPLLHGLERKGYLRSAKQLSEGRVRRLYRATAVGKRALDAAKAKVRELFGELFEGTRASPDRAAPRSRPTRSTRASVRRTR
jgi:DNA-binding PadR family transcriptional regulator